VLKKSDLIVSSNEYTLEQIQDILMIVKYEYNNLVVEGEYNIDPIEKVSQKLFSLE
jgi:hypothetical protein